MAISPTRMKQKDAEKLLKENGFELVRQGNHKTFRNTNGKTFILPNTHSRELSPGICAELRKTLRA